jgi:hypothetical protein
VEAADGLPRPGSTTVIEIKNSRRFRQHERDAVHTSAPGRAAPQTDLDQTRPHSKALRGAKAPLKVIFIKDP